MAPSTSPILTACFTLVVLAGAFFVSALWWDTRSAYNEIHASIISDRGIYEAEKTIGATLFRVNQSGKGPTPAYYLARDALTADHNWLRRTFLAKRVHYSFHEDEILMTWLSQVYLGNGEYGLATTVKALFNKDIKELTEQEAVAIAALIMYPSLYRNDLDIWNAKQKQLLETLHNK